MRIATAIIGAFRRSSGARVVPLVALAAIVLASCLPAGPPLPVYPWQPSGPISPAASSDCKNILLVGDSVMIQTAAQVQAMYQGNGYCARVDDEAVIGSAPAYMLGWPSWTVRLQSLLSQQRYDAVVAFFQGNGSSVSPSNADGFLPSNEAETLNMVDAAAAAGVPVYWAAPMLSALGCAWFLNSTIYGYEAYRTWATTQLPSLRPNVTMVNENVLSPEAGPTQLGPATYNDRLAFATGTQRVRAPDCIHLDGIGPSVAAYEIVFSTQALWGALHTAGTVPASPPVLAPNVPVPAQP